MSFLICFSKFTAVDEVEILVFLLIFLFQEMWKSEDHNLSDDRGQEGGESRITYH